MSSAQETPAPRTIRRTFSQGNKSEEELIKRVVVWEAFARGITGGVAGGGIGGALMYAAHKYNWAGARHYGVSAKTGLVVTAAVAPFWFRAESTLVEAQQHPERFVLHPAHADAAGPLGARSGLPFWQRVLNFMYDKPMHAWAMIAFPAYGAIFAYESGNPATAAMPLSQRILHTRVYGQFTALAVLLGVGMTTDTMRKSGGRFEPVDLSELAADHPVATIAKKNTGA